MHILLLILYNRGGDTPQKRFEFAERVRVSPWKEWICNLALPSLHPQNAFADCIEPRAAMAACALERKRLHDGGCRCVFGQARKGYIHYLHVVAYRYLPHVRHHLPLYRENQLVDEATRLRRRRKAWLEETEIVLREVIIGGFLVKWSCYLYTPRSSFPRLRTDTQCSRHHDDHESGRTTCGRK